jgi:hypothetical protein
VTFLPRSLYEQFTRLGNVYFTLVAVLSTTDLSPVSPITCILPLAMVIGISLIKEAVEDHHRAKLDRQVRLCAFSAPPSGWNAASAVSVWPEETHACGASRSNAMTRLATCHLTLTLAPPPAE